MTYSARGVTVRVGRATLLADASVEIRPGELVAVAGPNGAGKTTLVGSLAGDIHPADGSVSLDGRTLDGWPSAQLARRRAVMGPDRSVAFAFTALEVTLLGRSPYHGGSPDAEDHAIAHALLEAVDCAHLEGRIVSTLSTGERQRVHLARTLAQVTATQGTPEAAEPQYLLLDEPTSSLDPAHQHTAMRLLRKRAEGGLGVLAVLHDLNLAAAYADRVVLMKEAKVVEAGAPANVLRTDVLEHVFDIPMLVMPHPQSGHPLVIAEADRSA